jgi:heat shock protein HspQ
MKIELKSKEYDDATWYDVIVNDINTRVVAFLTENFDFSEDEVKGILSQHIVEIITQSYVDRTGG